MTPLPLHEFHHSLGARFGELNGAETVANYGDVLAEHAALRERAGVLDLSFRSRICLTGADRARFLHGQVTNDVNRLRPGEGCYAAITTAKGKMESDVNIYALQDELLLDFEPGLTQKISERLEKFIVSDDVQVVDVASLYGFLSVQGPKSVDVLKALGIFPDLPRREFQSIKVSDSMLGEIYLINQSRAPGSAGVPPASFGLFVPADSLAAVADKLIAAAKSLRGRACGWDALEIARIEAGIPRFGADMDESNIPLECGIEARAVSYKKGCYIGQEVINRIHSFGHVNKELRGLRLAEDLPTLPAKGDKLFHEGKEVGYVTSAVKSPLLNANIALGSVRREANAPGTELMLRSAEGESKGVIAEIP
ncbi:MAG TPA: aminomethyltransferase family protein, partial [Verrucomicrobiae bacterium]